MFGGDHVTWRNNIQEINGDKTKHIEIDHHFMKKKLDAYHLTLGQQTLNILKKKHFHSR